MSETSQNPSYYPWAGMLPMMPSQGRSSRASQGSLGQINQPMPAPWAKQQQAAHASSLTPLQFYSSLPRGATATAASAPFTPMPGTRPGPGLAPRPSTARQTSQASHSKAMASMSQQRPPRPRRPTPPTSYGASRGLATPMTPIVLRTRGIRAAKNKLEQAEQIIQTAVDEGRIRHLVAFAAYVSLAGNENRADLLRALRNGAV